MEKGYEWLPDDSKAQNSECWWQRPEIIESEPSFMKFNPFYYNVRPFELSGCAIAIVLPPPYTV